MIPFIRKIIIRTAWIRASILKILSVLILFSALVLLFTDMFVLNQNKPNMLITTADGWGTWNWSTIKVDNYEVLYDIWIEVQAMTPISMNSNKLPNLNGSEQMKIRLQTVEKVCNYYKLNEKSTLWKMDSNKEESLGDRCDSDRCSVLTDDLTDLFFCFIPKVASARFKQYFMTLIDINVTTNYLGFHSDANFLLNRVSPSYYTRNELAKYFYKKIIFVRHPFTRLVSVFLDKLVKPRRRTVVIDGKELVDLYYAYSVPIMKRYRGSDFNEKEKPRLTFNEFANYLLETPPIYYDAHWIPFWIRCEPCLVKYDYVGKVETLNNDAIFAFDFNYQTTTYNSSITESFALKIFENIPLTTRTQLYQIYKLDFEMFGYSADNYLKI